MCTEWRIWFGDITAKSRLADHYLCTQTQRVCFMAVFKRSTVKIVSLPKTSLTKNRQLLDLGSARQTSMSVTIQMKALDGIFWWYCLCYYWRKFITCNISKFIRTKKQVPLAWDIDSAIQTFSSQWRVFISRLYNKAIEINVEHMAILKKHHVGW